jgi:hypothetical protein
MFTSVLTKYLIPQDETESFTRSIRAGKYEMLRSPSRSGNGLRSLEKFLPI